MAGFQSPDAQAFTAALADSTVDSRVRAIVNKSLKEYEYIMEWGSNAERGALMRSALPGLLRAMATKDAQDQDQEMRQAYRELREAFQAHVATNRPDDVPASVPSQVVA